MLAKRKAMAEQPAQEASTSGGLGGILGKITDAEKWALIEYLKTL